MSRTLLWLVIPSIVGGWTLAGASASAQVTDEGGFFSAPAIEKANEIINEIQDRYGKELVIQTYKALPGANVEQVTKMSKAERNRFYSEWARRQFRKEEVDGIYILITREPAHLQVEVGNKTEHVFSRQSREELLNGMLRKFGDKQYDDGLLDGCRFVESHMRAAGVHKQGGGAVRHSGNPIMSWICLAVVGVGLVWLVIALIRAFSGGGGGGYGGGGYGGGGGGFMSGLMGGLFGAMAGNWIYNSFFGHSSDMGSSSAYAGDSGADYGPDTDATGAGGDFGDDAGGGGDFGDSGGGDFGGGDFGGGDFGGGDFGGGGDF